MSRISSGPRAVSGLGRAPHDPIQRLPHVQAKERENHPHLAVNPHMKEPPEMNHDHWIWIYQINGGDAILTNRRIR